MATFIECLDMDDVKCLINLDSISYISPHEMNKGTTQINFNYAWVKGADANLNVRDPYDDVKQKILRANDH